MKDIALSGFKWSSLQQIGFQGINYISIIFLANYVKPEIHGFFAITTLAAGLAGVIGSVGLREIIIKDRDKYFNEKIPAYWSLVILVACVVYALAIVLSLMVAYFYQGEFSFIEIFYTSIVLSLIAPLGVIRSMMEALHSRNYEFKKISLVTLISFLVGVIPVFFLGYLGFDRLALGGKFLLPHFSYFVMGLFFYRLDFEMKWDASVFIEIKKFLTYYSLNNFINYFLRNIDYMIIGKLFSPSVLGEYVIAYKILLVPLKNVTSTITRVGMPLLSKTKIPGRTFKRRYFSLIEGVSLLTFPIMFFISLNSETIVELFFGDKYVLLSSMIRTLSIVGAIQSIVSPVGMLFVFKEKMKLMFQTNILSLSVTGSVIFASSLYGDIHVVLVNYAFSYILLVMPISLYSIYKRYQFSILDSIKAYSPYLLSSLIASCIIYICHVFFVKEMNPINILLLNVLIFALSYLLSLSLVDRYLSGTRFYHEYLVKLGLKK